MEEVEKERTERKTIRRSSEYKLKLSAAGDLLSQKLEEAFNCEFVEMPDEVKSEEEFKMWVDSFNG